MCRLVKPLLARGASNVSVTPPCTDGQRKGVYRDSARAVNVHESKVRRSVIVHRQAANSDVSFLLSVELYEFHVVHAIPAQQQWHV